MRYLKMLFLAAGLIVAAAPAALAQAGSVVVMNYERVLATSAAGRDLETKLRQMAEQMQGEVQSEQTAVQTEARNLQQATQGRPADQVQRDSALQTRVQAFNTRAEALRTQQMTRARDLEYSRQQALNTLNQQLEPLVREVMTSRRAGVVIDASAASVVSEGVDITQDVITRLDARVRTVNAPRLTAPAQQQQSANH